MSLSQETLPPGRAASGTRLLVGTTSFLVAAIVGLAIVKWMPYWQEAHLAAAAHSIGASIVSGSATAAPAVGLQAAWQYAVAYFTAVWEAVVLALLLGATVQVFVPRRWLRRLIGGANVRSTAIAGAFSLTGMM